MKPQADIRRATREDTPILLELIRALAEYERLAHLVSADEALACGFLLQVCTPDELGSAATRLCERLSALAPVTQSVSKEGLRRLMMQGLPDGEDLIRRCYGSADFHRGVTAFGAKTSPVWTGM